MSVYNFGGTGRNLMKLYQGTWREAGVFKWTLILQGVPLQKVIDAHVDPPKWIFRNTKFRPLGGVDPEIFTHTRHWPRLDSAYHKPDRGSPKKF